MVITDVRIRKTDGEGKMRAICSVTFDNMFVVRDIRIIEGQKGLFVAMPSRRTPNGDFRDVAHPITQEAREMISQRILEEYRGA
ncbi:MAG: septation regulator SpoVG [Firmicutes bacterium]|nr:septation regulator SpoVG [Bacillota bacterium]